MKTFAERAWAKGKAVRPTVFLPNGCGPAATGSIDFVPDSIAGVKFGHECCDAHDLEYHRGGFSGLFTRKIRADVALGRCISQRLRKQGRLVCNSDAKGRKYALGVAQRALGPVVGIVYTLAVLTFGWTPLTWRWTERPVPTHDELVALQEAIKAKKA